MRICTRLPEAPTWRTIVFPLHHNWGRQSLWMPRASTCDPWTTPPAPWNLYPEQSQISTSLPQHTHSYKVSSFFLPKPLLCIKLWDFNWIEFSIDIADIDIDMYILDPDTPTRPQSMAVPDRGQGWDTQVARALYAYLSSGDNQLSFLEGDIIALMGESSWTLD